MSFHQNEAYEAAFSLVGVDAAIANALRRILLAEIPTLAIETVFVFENTSIVQDEVLAHRVGLVPLTGPPALLRWLQLPPRLGDGEAQPDRDDNTIMLRLAAACSWNARRSKAADDAADPLAIYHNAHVYASQLEWLPQGRQEAVAEGGGIRAFNEGILLAKLRPGQAIEFEARAVKGFGGDHAKFSPVATASYRLLPTIDIVAPILGEEAVKFQACFPKGVIALESVTDEEAGRAGGGYEGRAGERKAVVRDAFADTVSRECLRHDEFVGKVRLGRVRDHFIFSVESTGQFRSDELFLDSVAVLRAKCSEFGREMRESGW